MSKKLTLLIAIMGLLALSGVAAAAEDESDDTVFNFGYDSAAGAFVWNTSATDDVYDCTLENGPLNTTYTRVPDGVVLVDELADPSGEVVSFPARPPEEVAEDVDPADGPIEYSGADGECGLSGGTVAGPQGQINHGMFMKLFNSRYDGQGRGCVVRHLARSGLGKGDQQVRVGDIDPDEETEELDEGTVEFETALADCKRGNKDEATPEEETSEEEAPDPEPGAKGQQKAAENRPEHAGQGGGRNGPPGDGQPGNSGSAPGRNR